MRALRRRYGHAMTPGERDEAKTKLARLKTERAELLALYGDKGQRHPMARMIGGLNPAAQRLYVVRGQIAELTKRLKASAPIVACDACLNWHVEGKHTASAAERKKNLESARAR